MNPLESAKRYVVYAPLGLAAMLRDLGPSMVAMLAEKGRQELAKPNVVKDSVGRVGEYAQLAVTARHRTQVADEAPFPRYDSLTAAQVVAHLKGLSEQERLSVRSYELAHRARKGVLSHLEAR
ncbi:MAG: hypothetical protein WBD02_06545 [Acidimicrobiia bacterium]